MRRTASNLSPAPAAPVTAAQPVGATPGAHAPRGTAARTSPGPARRPRRHGLRQGALLVALAAAGWAGVGAAGAHEWPSPGSERGPGRQAPPMAPWQPPAWSGLRWAGPQDGPPPAPSARDCHRLPKLVELEGPAGSRRAPREPRTYGRDDDGAVPSAEAPAEALSAAPPPGVGAAAPAARGKAEAEASSARGAPAAADAAGHAAAEAPVAVPQASRSLRERAPAPAQRPANEPVTAGVVDDNADFGRYLDFRARHAGLPARPMDVSERYRVVVHDAVGRPVPDADVRVSVGGQPLPIWLRTDAGGQAWLHPRVAASPEAFGGWHPAAWPAPSPSLTWASPTADGSSGAPVLEVAVRKGSGRGALHGRALLQRGQRDDLQIRLDGRAPVEPTRLDLVFLVDATGSMADEIGKLAASMRAMAAQIAQLPSQPDICFGLVAYRDRGDEFFVRSQDFTDDLGAFQRSLAALRAQGGGDYPEALHEALHTAVHGLSWRGDGATRLVVLVADAPPHLEPGQPRGLPSYDFDLQAATARGVKLLAVGASGLDPLGEVVFRQAAQFTGGRFVFLTYADARDPSSGPGRQTTHEVENYSVESLDKLIVRLVREELARRPA